MADPVKSPAVRGRTAVDRLQSDDNRRVTSGQGVDPAERGTLTVRNRAGARLVERAVLSVDCVERHSRFTRRDLPRAIVDMTPEAPNIRVDIAAAWPAPLADTCRATQRRVIREIQEQTGRTPARVDVTISGLVPGAPTAHVEPRPDFGAERTPMSQPAAGPVAVVAAAALIAVGIIAGRELLIQQELIDGAPWLANAFTWAGRLTWQGWMLPAAIAAVVAGVLILTLGLKRQRPTHVRTGGSPALWLRTTDMARRCTAAALRVDGVAEAHTAVGRKRVDVTVKPGADSRDGLGEPVAAEVRKALAQLQHPMQLEVAIERRPAR
ncbi:Asp23/Gls24 family envelope stress response protein [Skermania sp. ID1734]|uniref:DUF6286 domain-containing Asp23/Gls24 family envelope stress response protein n=1 Tax=Skermania sp. ID1734 TaxID=2597516 RepID=UPI00117EDFA8|nr:DUF6286 domain-containing protein [Skermania sp. ID1734]TSD93188.1 Asp23/Gls24 family envelope stress response protein [Skermania sp. ID1734]